MIGRLRAWLGRARSRPAVPVVALPPAPTFAEELAQSGSDPGRWVSSRPASGTLYSSLDADTIRNAAQRYPEQVSATIAAAERVCRHEFDMLGSGPYEPVDPGRPVRGSYRPIDWYLDPVKGLRFPEKVPHTQWNLLEMRPRLADVKFPWELGRCQHWMPLAQAFRLTGDVKYAIEVLDQHDDFMEANPVGLGVNWTCAMDVAIRAFNWAMAFDLLQSQPSVPRERLAALAASIFDHGHFIERNLENKYEVTSNHFLSNVVGLYGVGLLFGELPSALRWRSKCREWLEQEMQVQVLPDGADYESSVPYHRLVSELFLSGERLADREGRPLSTAYRDRLRAMVVFLSGVLRPDGLLPQIGDADDGRVHVFSNYGRWQPQDARHLLGAASAIFHAEDWWPADDPWAAWEATWWGAEPVPGASARTAATLFADAGIAVVKRDALYLLVSNGKVGTNGFGNHKHNDLLSFEFHDGGQPLIVDPGSYVYTSDPEARNYFRSTLAHNTVTVDGTEQNEFKSEWLFRMFEKAKPDPLEMTVSDTGVRCSGRHDGYMRLSDGVMHERRFALEFASGRLEIDDEMRGRGTHAFEWRFHCAPGVEAHVDGDALRLVAGGRHWRLRADPGLPATVQADWYSPSYGVRLPTVTIAFADRVDLARQSRWRFTLERVS